MAESFSEIVNIYCSFDINRKFYDEFFNINNDSANSKNIVKKENLEKNTIDKNVILDNFLEESINNNINNINDNIFQKNDKETNHKIPEDKIINFEDITNNIYNSYSEINTKIKDNNILEKKDLEKTNNLEIKNAPKTKTCKITINELSDKIKNCKENKNKDKICNNDVINNIKSIEIKKVDKYILMIKLYENLISNKIDNSRKFLKYLEENNANDYVYILSDKKYRRLYEKCKRLNIIKDYIDINSLYYLKITDNIFSLKMDEFNNLILSLKNK